MATTYVSGDLSTSNTYIKMKIEVIVNSQSTANNTSNVTINVWARRTNSGYETYGTGTAYCRIDGTEYTNSISSSQHIVNPSDYPGTDSKGIKLFTKTMNITHGSDGKKTLSLASKLSISGAGLGGSYQSYSCTLPAIQRGVIYVKSGGTYQKGLARVKVSGSYKNAVAVYVKSGGTWRLSI